ncbi:hypothetical protein BD779DRAFT_1482608 [Infundibulicybe gibba]|nr:hypothetical protein BD779DRAFT_1482608 [Infundibulicybe gibba]
MSNKKWDRASRTDSWLLILRKSSTTSLREHPPRSRATCAAGDSRGTDGGSADAMGFGQSEGRSRDRIRWQDDRCWAQNVEAPGARTTKPHVLVARARFRESNSSGTGISVFWNSYVMLMFPCIPTCPQIPATTPNATESDDTVTGVEDFAHADVLCQLGVSLAGFGAPIQELKSLIVFLQASSQNWNHYRAARLGRVNCMAAINHFGPTENGPTGVELTSSAVVVFCVYISSDMTHWTLASFPVTQATMPPIDYNISSRVEELRGSESVVCERRIKRYADSGPSQTIAARGSWNGEIDLKRIFRWNPIFKPNGITIWLLTGRPG